MSDDMGESKYLQAHSRRNRQPQSSPQEPTPYSAVSSFNLPPFCDSSLITPVTQSPTMSTKTAPVLKSERDIKLSPSMMSPTFNFMAGDDDYGGRYNNLPMKYKHPPGTIQMSAADSPFPISPYVCPEPFWGSYNVSATPISGRSESSPSGNCSPPQIHSAGGLSNTISPHTQQQASAHSTSSYRGQNHTPMLIAPNPTTFRASPATNLSRQNSLHSVSTTTSSVTPAQSPFPDPVGSFKPRGKKRKSPSRDREKGVVLADVQTQEEEVLLDLSYVQHLPWKQVTRMFNERFPNGKEVQESTLQMRKKRLIDRLRMWTDEDERALTLAVEEFDKNRWDTISNNMLKYGCVSKWPKELCQKKWREMHPEDCPWIPRYEMSIQHRDSGEWDPEEGAYSEGRASACHSLQEGDSGVPMSAISTTAMEEVRSRAASDASSLMIQSRQQQRQMMFDQQNCQRTPWDREA